MNKPTVAVVGRPNVGKLGPGEPVGIEGKHSHHQIQNLFVFPNQG